MPVPLKDLSSNLWRPFSPKCVVACKDLTKFHWKFPVRKKSPFFGTTPYDLERPSLLALRVSISVYEGISGKLFCGTQVATPIRTLFCNAALSCLIGCMFPSCHFVLPVWCPLQWETETSVGRWTASKGLRSWSAYLIGDPCMVKWPLCFQIAACLCSTRKACFPSLSSKAQIKEGDRVKNLTRGYSQAWIFNQHYLISEDPLISHP